MYYKELTAALSKMLALTRNGACDVRSYEALFTAFEWTICITRWT